MKPIDEMREVVVAGIGLVRWQRYEDQEIYDFGSEAILNALQERDKNLIVEAIDHHYESAKNQILTAIMT